MEFDVRTTGGLFALLLFVVVAGTVTSPMPTTLSAGISVGLAIFGIVTLALGIKHGEHRATRSGRL
jgi:hypothetical protein